MNATTALIPHLTCRNATEAYGFYQRAFGATPGCLMPTSSGLVLHAALHIGGSPLYLADEFPDGGKSPQTLGGSPVTLHLQVPDCDSVFNKAVDAGCTVLMPLDNMFWGDRYGIIADPYGHQWSIATTVREVSPGEMTQAASQF